MIANKTTLDVIHTATLRRQWWMAYSILGWVKPFFLVLVLCACQRGAGSSSLFCTSITSCWMIFAYCVALCKRYSSPSQKADRLVHLWRGEVLHWSWSKQPWGCSKVWSQSMMQWTTSTVAGVPARWWWICGKRGPLANCETLWSTINFSWWIF